MSFTGMPDWKRLDRDDFERLVEVLLIRKYASDTGVDVLPLDGRGGDGGIDVGVWRKGVLEHVYQLKHFPEGFSGGFATRRKQIKRSFNRVMKEKGPERWTLVTPGNVTPGELKFVNELGEGVDVEVKTPMGRGELDNELVQHADLLHAATRDPLLEKLRSMSLQRIALTTAAEIAEAGRDLAGRLDEVSAHWSPVMWLTGGQVVRSVVPKHPRASELEPLGLRFTLDQSALDPRTASVFGEMLRYGIGDSVTIPSSAVELFEFIGPSWFAGEHEGGDITLVRAGVGDEVGGDVEIRAVDESGSTKQSWRGTVAARGGGDVGAHLAVAVRGGVRLTFRLPRDATVAPTVELTHTVAGSDPTSAVRAFEFLRTMRLGERFDLVLDGARLVGFVSTAGALDYADMPYLMQLADDLVVLERELGLALRMPETLTGLEREVLRVLRLTLEGRCCGAPFLTSMTAQLSGLVDEHLRGFLLGEGGALVAHSDTVFEVLGHQVTIPGFGIVVQSPRVRGGAEIWAAAEAGDIAGRSIVVSNEDGGPFSAYIVDRWVDPNAPLTPEPLGLEVSRR